MTHLPVILYKTTAGSRLYGTHRADSDTDVRGVVAEPIASLIGLQAPFEQIETTEPDMVLYGLRKFVRLALANNPNILDTLFAPPEFWLLSTPAWQQIHALRHSFLSQQVRQTYVGYARSQLKKLETAERYKLKHAAHLVRLILQARDILILGHFTPVLQGECLDKVLSALHGEWAGPDIARWAHKQFDSIMELPSDLPLRPAGIIEIEAAVIQINVKAIQILSAECTKDVFKESINERIPA